MKEEKEEKKSLRDKLKLSDKGKELIKPHYEAAKVLLKK